MLRAWVVAAVLSAEGCTVAFGIKPIKTFRCDTLVPPPAFCADFDEGTAATAGWTGIDDKGSAGTIAVDDQLSASPPASARITMAANPPDCSYERLHHSIEGPFTQGYMSYEVRLGDASGAAPDAIISELGLDLPGGEDYLIYVRAGATAAEVIEQHTDPSGSSTQSSHSFGLLPVGSWSTLRLDLDLTAAPQFTFSVDGDRAIEASIFVPLPAATGLRPALGLGCVSSSSGAIELHYDDVAIDTRAP